MTTTLRTGAPLSLTGRYGADVEPLDAAAACQVRVRAAEQERRAAAAERDALICQAIDAGTKRAVIVSRLGVSKSLVDLISRYHHRRTHDTAMG